MVAFVDFAADLTLGVIKFLDVVDSSRLAVTSQRYYYLVMEYRQQRGAELVAVANANTVAKRNEPPRSIITRSVHALQSKPNLILSFSTAENETREGASNLEKTYGSSYPSPTILLGAEAYSIQVNIPQSTAKAMGTNSCITLEHSSSFSLMAVNFPNARVLPFKVTFHQRDLETILLERQLEAVGDLSTWKAMILYAADQEGQAMVEKFITRIQHLLPQIAIVGGMCDGGYVSKQNYTRDELMTLSVAQLRTFPEARGLHFSEKSELVDHIQTKKNDLQSTIYELNAGLFGVVLGGDVPVKSVVSRGVRSAFHGKEESISPFVVEKSRIVHPSDDDYMFDFRNPEDATSYHLISKIRDTDAEETMSAMQLIARGIESGHRAEFIGLKRLQSDGFELENLHHMSARTGDLIVFTDGSRPQSESLEGAEIDLFYLDGVSCMEDMDKTIATLKEQTKGEEILGAVMFSCAGRGPEPSHLIPEEMSDAKRFAKGFPKVPCLGFYAGGEIGPLALAANENVFQTGRAAVQGQYLHYLLSLQWNPLYFN
ncbi:FIST domain containing protein [Nitzschia inconspicua]|uniref:FIST domain containing protein n=1 Tax=Nitzschia inconspicua TaxID=303405 RepID=A0A9K3KDB3_9STRA|nr:FIST domain containing protein [Nitzschia inconspicua]